jgi:hypothetical protein
MIKFLAVLCEPAFVGLVRLLHRRYAIRFQGKRVYWKTFITEMGRDLCRIILGGKSLSVRLFRLISHHHDISKNAFRRQAVCELFSGLPGRTRSRMFGFVGYIRRHGFILPTIRDWFFMPHGGGLQWMTFRFVPSYEL